MWWPGIGITPAKINSQFPYWTIKTISELARDYGESVEYYMGECLWEWEWVGVIVDIEIYSVLALTTNPAPNQHPNKKHPPIIIRLITKQTRHPEPRTTSQ